MKPIIAVTALYDDDKDSLWMLPGYFDGITRAGGIPVMLPLYAEREDVPALLSRFDGLLIAGGHDTMPQTYGAENRGKSIPCAARDAIESELLRCALEHDVPVLGICRGIQFMNAALGGTLYQDLPSERPSPVSHIMKPPYDRGVHQVRILPDTPLYELLHTETLSVNSYHHQAVRDLAPSLEIMAVAEDGLVEAVYRRDQRFVWAVQWHPEFWAHHSREQQTIFDAFVSACSQ
ncbi:MAG: gamma-glutamyl-gamma-aminobutyrate hydrolase family protein [Butyricicoccaceae bacterium]